MLSDNTLELSWNDFSNYSTNTFKNLWEDKSMTDVTLSTQDDNTIRAHKAILCSMSPYFRNVLSTKNNQDVIVIKHIDHSNLERVLKFAYLGQCEVNEKELDKFLAAGTLLKMNFSNEDINIRSKMHNQNENINSKISSSNGRERYRFQCHYCDKKYITTAHRKDHMQVNHIKVKNFACDQCLFTCYKMYVLRNHRQSKHEGIIYYCDFEQCFHKTTTIVGMKKHTLSIHEGLLHVCSMCPYTSNSENNLYKHTQDIHKAVRYICDICEYKARSKHDLGEHKVSAHKKVKYSGQQCDFVSTRKIDFEIHQKVHGNFDYACTKCEYKAGLASDLKLHMKINHETKYVYKYGCQKCTFRSTQINKLNKHTDSKHGGNLVSCNKYDYKENGKRRQMKYKKKNSRLNTICCNLCDFRFSNKDDLAEHRLKQHMKVTHKTKYVYKFGCQKCTSKSTKIGKLNKYTDFKHGGNLVSCNEYNYKVKGNRSQIKYEKKTANEYTICCNLCDFRFPNKDDLAKHRKISHVRTSVIVSNMTIKEVGEI